MKMLQLSAIKETEFWEIMFDLKDKTFMMIKAKQNT